MLRLTKLAVTHDSRRLENYCTEVLAWCCLVSPAFLKKLLGFFHLPKGEYRVHTQFSAKLVESEDAPKERQFYFDLVFESAEFVLVVEVKTWSEFRENQLSDYSAAAKQKFGKHRRTIGTITPFGDHRADSEHHVSWGKIQNLLQTIDDDVKETTTSVFRQFAHFLKEHNLGSMSPDKISLDGIQPLIVVAPKYNQLFELLRAVREAVDKNSGSGPLFGKARNEPVFQYYDEAKRYFIEITSRESEGKPQYSAAISFPCKGRKPSLHLWISLHVHGEHASRRLPKKLLRYFKDATPLLPDTDASANFGRTIDGTTWFNFARPLNKGLADKPSEIIAWFEDTLNELKSFVEALPAQAS